MDLTRKMSFVVIALCLLFSLKNQTAETNNKASSSTSPTTTNPSSSTSTTSTSDSAPLAPDSPTFYSNREEQKYAEAFEELKLFRYGFYRTNCPKAELIVQITLYRFRQGCDESATIDDDDSIGREKEYSRGFDIIDIIKSELDKECPGIVTCADLLVLAVRESINLAGGPFYPLHSGRNYNTTSDPQDDRADVVASKAFDEGKIVSLLAHDAGIIRCKFFSSWLRGSDFLNSTLDTDFHNLLKAKCNHSNSLTSGSPSTTSSLHLSPSASSPSSLSLPKFSSTFQTTEGLRKGSGTLTHRSLSRRKHNTKISKVFSILGTVFSALLFLSPWQMLLDIYKKGSVGHYREEGFVAALVSSVVWVFYSTVVGKSMLTPLILNSVGIGLNFLCLLLFLYYGNKGQRTRLALYLVLVVILVSVSSGVIFGIRDKRLKVHVAGGFSAFFGSATYVAPLVAVRHVVRTKNVKTLPLPISVVMILNATCWIVFGAYRKDKYILISNGIGALSGILQLVVYLIYCREKKKPAELSLELSME